VKKHHWVITIFVGAGVGVATYFIVAAVTKPSTTTPAAGGAGA
jgi:phage shock protein PspC (stress-responsive transcriptional regulator)